MTREEILNKISIEKEGMYFNQILDMGIRAKILQTALDEVLDQGQKLPLHDVRLSFDELSDKILKYNAKSEYQQASIVILRKIFEAHEA